MAAVTPIPARAITPDIIETGATADDMTIATGTSVVTMIAGDVTGIADSPISRIIGTDTTIQTGPMGGADSASISAIISRDIAGTLISESFTRRTIIGRIITRDIVWVTGSRIITAI